MKLVYGPWKTENSVEDRINWLKAILGDIDPAKYAGEGWYAVDEIAAPWRDATDPYIIAQAMAGGHDADYYPESFLIKKRRRKE